MQLCENFSPPPFGPPSRAPQLPCGLRKLKTKPNLGNFYRSSCHPFSEIEPNQTFWLSVFNMNLTYNTRGLWEDNVEVVIHNVKGDVLSWRGPRNLNSNGNIRESKLFSINTWYSLGERHVSAYLLTLTSCSTRFPNKQDKLDINGAEGGAPVLESIESISICSK